MTTTIHSSVLRGVEAVPVEVRVTHRGGDGQVQLIWKSFPEMSQRETAIRVRSALVGLGVGGVFEVACDVPAGCSASCLDFPIAIGVLAEAQNWNPSGHAIVGELNLGGELRPSRGMLAHLQLATARGKMLVGPRVPGAHLVPDAYLGSADTLAEAAAGLRCQRALRGIPPAPSVGPSVPEPDLADLRGCARAKRALEIAAAGGHSLLLVGGPGTGKTMLAQRLSGILPAMTAEEQLEVATIHDCAGLPGSAFGRPFRAPHHTCSEAGLLGGGSPVRPGEVTLAHHGVLFLDELPEWSAAVIHTLGHALAGMAVRVSGVLLPTRPAVVVAAQQPCPCGYFGSPKRECRCSEASRAQYRKRSSGFGPKFDLVVDLDAPGEALDPGEGDRLRSAEVQAGVIAAREVLAARNTAHGPILATVGRTIAALDGSIDIRSEHVAEAASFTP